MMGNIPPQALLDLGGLAELVRELKSGKGDTLLIELKDQVKELRALEQTNASQMEELSKKEESALRAISRADSAKEATKEAKATLRSDIDAFHREKQDFAREEADRRKALETQASDLQEQQKSLDSRLKGLLRKEKALDDKLQKATELETLYKEKIERITAAAVG